MKSESIIDAKTEHFVGAAVHIRTAHPGAVIVLRSLSIIFIGSPHIADIDSSSFGQLHFCSQTEGIGVILVILQKMRISNQQGIYNMKMQEFLGTIQNSFLVY